MADSRKSASDRPLTLGATSPRGVGGPETTVVGTVSRPDPSDPLAGFLSALRGEGASPGFLSGRPGQE